MNRETALKQNLDLQREILARLRRGMSISEACRDLGITRDGKFRYMRRKFKDFDAAVKEIRWGHNQSPDDPNAVGTSEREWGAEFEDARIESFLVTFRETGDKDASARASGFLPTTVLEMLDPTSKKYHAEFSRAMREEELRAAWAIEDDAWRQARAGDATMQRFILERRNPDYGQRARSATDANDAKFHPGAFQEAMKLLKEHLIELRKSSGQLSGAGRVPGSGDTATDDRGVAEGADVAPESPGIN